MKITEIKETKKLSFEKLEVGDVFIFNNNDYYLKIPVAVLNNFDRFNAINLSNWDYLWIEKNYEITRVNAELIITK